MTLAAHLECPCCGGVAFESDDGLFGEWMEPSLCGCRVGVEVYDDADEPYADVWWCDDLPCPQCDGAIISWLWWYLALDETTHSRHWWGRRPVDGWWEAVLNRNLRWPFRGRAR